jgi:putative SOS response-associated peptidase YedK
MLFTIQESPVFAFAALWEPGHRDHPTGAVILTMQPNELVATVHDRMPVILRKSEIEAWLSGGEGEFLRRSFAADEMSMSVSGTDLSLASNRRAARKPDDSQPGLFG